MRLFLYVLTALAPALPVSLMFVCTTVSPSRAHTTFHPTCMYTNMSTPLVPNAADLLYGFPSGNVRATYFHGFFDYDASHFYAITSFFLDFTFAVHALLALLALTMAIYAFAPRALAAMRAIWLFSADALLASLCFISLLMVVFATGFTRRLLDFIFAPCTSILCATSYIMMIVLFLIAPLTAPHAESHFMAWLTSPFRRANLYAHAFYVVTSSSLASYRNGPFRLFALRTLASSSACPWIILSALITCVLAVDDTQSSKPPSFDGTRAGFTSWIMIFTAWVAWKQTEVVGVMDGSITAPPEPPAPLEPIDPATLDGADPALAAVTATYAVWQASMVVWNREHQEWDQQVTVFNDLNTKLYGAVLQAVPEWLRTSLYLTYRNRGFEALESLRNQFDAVDANDHASHMARLQARYIDGKNEISENDLRLQYDNMMTACAGIIRTRNAPPNEAALIAIFDNSLPIAYSQIRQLVRRAGHATLSAHWEDYMGQVRAELAARAPLITAFSASSAPSSSNTGNSERGDRDRSQRTGGTNLCLRCAKPGHSRPQCKKPKKACKHCKADHSSRLCPKGPGGSLRDSLSDNARRLLDQDVSRMQDASSSDESDSAAAPTVNGTPVPAPATAPAKDGANMSDDARIAASAAAACCDTPEAAGQAYIAALKALGF